MGLFLIVLEHVGHIFLNDKYLSKEKVLFNTAIAKTMPANSRTGPAKEILTNVANHITSRNNYIVHFVVLLLC